MTGLLTPEELWNHWEGHRRLTLRTIEAFPEAEFRTHLIQNMRSFAELMGEIVDVEESTMRGLKTGEWRKTWEPSHQKFSSKAELLGAFAQVREASKAIFSGLTIEKLRAVETDGWGVTAPNLERLFYVIDNEIHHRGQTYVYLRLLGVEPPAFYER